MPVIPPHTQNYPYIKQDANGRDLQDSSGDMTFRGDYTSNNLIYKGFAKPGSAEGSLVWQIAKLAYDGSNNILSIKWPQDANGAASSDYAFSWTGRAGYTYS